MKFEDFRKKFEISDAMLRELVNIGKSVNVPYDESGFQVSKELIKHRVKSQIARNVWGNEGFYPIYNEQDEIFQKALTLFDEARELASR
jgi:carboxyl-terminal processing protease